jgi:SAM-dependent methyltransferase
VPANSLVLSPADAAIVETFVVPRYLALYSELALEMLLISPSARLVHVGCRTGHPDREFVQRFEDATLVGIDPSASALELARNKAAIQGAVELEYMEVPELPSPLRARSFSHAVSLCPIATREERVELLAELSGLLYAGGQALIALPLRGSFQQVGDLWREYALKHDDGAFAEAVEGLMTTRPNLESLSEELEECGLEDVDVEVNRTTLVFDSGRAFVEDPVTRLLIMPELERALGVPDLSEPMAYLRDAIDKYWSEGEFELSLVVGCASARKGE